MKRLVISLLPLAALAACSAEPDAPDAPVAEPSASPSATQEAPPSEPAAETEVGVIPAEFFGVWDYVEGSCLPASDLRLEIARERFTFYESVGEVEDVERRDDGFLAVTLAMTGEGESWDNTLGLRLVEDGTILEVDQPGVNGEPNLRRKRCEG